MPIVCVYVSFDFRFFDSANHFRFAQGTEEIIRPPAKTEAISPPAFPKYKIGFDDDKLRAYRRVSGTKTFDYSDEIRFGENVARHFYIT